MTQCPIATPPLLDSRGMTEAEHREMLQHCGLVVMCCGDLSSAQVANDLDHARAIARRLAGIYRRPVVIFQPVGIVTVQESRGGA